MKKNVRSDIPDIRIHQAYRRGLITSSRVDKACALAAIIWSFALLGLGLLDERLDPALLGLAVLTLALAALFWRTGK